MRNWWLPDSCPACGLGLVATNGKVVWCINNECRMSIRPLPRNEFFPVQEKIKDLPTEE